MLDMYVVTASLSYENESVTTRKSSIIYHTYILSRKKEKHLPQPVYPMKANMFYQQPATILREKHSLGVPTSVEKGQYGDWNSPRGDHEHILSRIFILE